MKSKATRGFLGDPVFLYHLGISMTTGASPGQISVIDGGPGVLLFQQVMSLAVAILAGCHDLYPFVPWAWIPSS